MTQHEHPNVTLVREGFEAFQKGDTGWMDRHLDDDVVWHVGGNSKWSGAYQGKANVLEYFARQAQATSGPPLVDIHDIVGNDDHVVVLGTASATAPDGSTPRLRRERDPSPRSPPGRVAGEDASVRTADGAASQGI